MLRIRTILIWIWILGSVLWTTDPDPALIGSGFQDANKNEFFKKFIFLFLTVGTGTIISVFKDNMSLRSHKTVEIMVYLNCLLDDRGSYK